MRSRKLFGAALICVALLAITMGIPALKTGSKGGRCKPEVYRSVPVPSSDWVVENRGSFCGFGIAGGWDIRARDTKTGAVVLIAEGDGVLRTDVLAAPGKITVQIGDSLRFLPIRDSFGSVQVDYQDTSQDDPKVRATYERWVHHRRTPANMDWYCTTILARLDQANFDRFNEDLAELYFPNSERKSYCQ